MSNSYNFLSLFPDCQNMHLTKDVGQIPEILARNFNYQSFILSYKNGPYPNAKLLSHTQLLFFPKKNYVIIDEFSYPSILSYIINKIRRLFQISLNLFIFLLKFQKRIDIFQVYGFKIETFIFSGLHRIFNKKGLFYIKLDINPSLLYKNSNFYRTTLILDRMHQLLKFFKIDVISIENQSALRILSHYPFFRFINSKVYVPNGIDNQFFEELILPLEKKENIILHLGRIGLPALQSDLLLEAFIHNLSKIPNWKLIFIGIMEPVFKEKYTKLLQEQPSLTSVIVYIPYIHTRSVLFSYYKRAKLIAIVPRYAGFPLVALEAGFFGVVILGSKIPSLIELTENGNFGYILPTANRNEFYQKFGKILQNSDDIICKAELFQHHIQTQYSWIKICSNLNEIFNQHFIQ